PRFQHAVLEYHASVQRLKELAAAEIPNAAVLLGRIVEALEAYLRVQPPSGAGFEVDPAAGRASSAMEEIASRLIAEDVARADAAGADEPAPSDRGATGPEPEGSAANPDDASGASP